MGILEALGIVLLIIIAMRFAKGIVGCLAIIVALLWLASCLG